MKRSRRPRLHSANGNPQHRGSLSLGQLGHEPTTQHCPILITQLRQRCRWTHQHQIRRATNNAVLGHDYLAIATGVFAHSIAMRLDDLGMPDGTTVTLQIPEVTAWTFRWTADRSEWMLDSGINSAAVATILINAPTAIRLFTRGPVSVETGDVITTSGNTSIANKALMAMGNVFS